MENTTNTGSYYHQGKYNRRSVFTLIGLMMSYKITWHDHMEYMCGKASRRIYLLVLFKKAGKSSTDIIDIHMAIIRSVLEYVCTVWHPGVTNTNTNTKYK